MNKMWQMAAFIQFFRAFRLPLYGWARLTAIKLGTVQAIVFKITFIEKRLETVERDMVI